MTDESTVLNNLRTAHYGDWGLDLTSQDVHELWAEIETRDKRVAELEAMVDKLIEAGEVMKQACGDQWGWEDMFDDSEFTDFDDLATGWKERER